MSVSWGALAALLELIPFPAEVVSASGDSVVQNTLAHERAGALEAARGYLMRTQGKGSECAGEVYELTLHQPETFLVIVYTKPSELPGQRRLL